MSILKQAPTEFTLRELQLKQLIAADLGVKPEQVTIKLITTPGPMIDVFRGERGPDVFSRFDVTVS